MKKWWFNLVLIGGAVFYLYFKSLPNDPTRNSVSANSSRNFGTSHFFDQISQMQQGNLQKVRRAILNQETLTGIDSLFIISPLRPLSSYEVKVLYDFVKEGGKLFLSFHNKKTADNLFALLSKLEIATTTEANDSFKNYQVEVLSPQNSTKFLSTKESYAFYSNIHLGGDGCQSLRFDCYFINRKVEKGEVIVVAGLPPFNNAMLARENNADFAARLVAWAGNLALDEYHQLFPEKTWKDLITTANVSLPLGGLFLVIVTYFLFGQPPKSVDAVAALDQKTSISYHQLNSFTIEGQLESPTLASQAVDTHRKFLVRRFPEYQIEIDKAAKDIKDYKKARVQLLKIHRTILKRLGRI